MKNWLTLSDIGKSHRVSINLPIIGDKEGLSLVNYQLASEHTGKRIKEKLGEINLLEICCGVGGSSIFLAKYVKHISAVDTDSERIKAARINAKTFKVFNKIAFFVGNALDEKFLKKLVKSKRIDVAYADPDWREDSTKDLKDQTPNIFNTRPSVPSLFDKINRTVTPNIIMHLSKYSNREQIKSLSTCEIEKIKINNEVKFLNVYFGKLINFIGETEVSL